MQNLSREYIDLLSRCYGVMHLRQKNLAKMLMANWNIDLAEGVIKFDNGKNYNIAFIGSESSADNTFLWGSKNINNFADFIVSDVKNFHASNIINPVYEIRNECFPVTEFINGDMVSVFMAYFMKKCYYRCDHGGGSFFVILKNTDDEVLAPLSCEEIATALPEILESSYAEFLNFYIFMKSIFECHCTSIDEKRKTLTGYFDNGNKKYIRCTFDDMGSVVNINAAL